MESQRTDSPETADSQINPAQWSRLTGAASREDFFPGWLALQCSFVPNLIQGLLVIGNPQTRTYSPVARWPERGGNAERLAELSERVIDEQCGLLVELDSSPANKEPHYGVAYPIIIDEQFYGLIAAEVAAYSEEQLKPVMEHLQWGVSWIELFFIRRQSRDHKKTLDHLRLAVDLLAGTLSEEKFEGAAMTFATELATALKCDRVSLGMMKGRYIKLRAMSHSTQFGERMNLVHSIEKAMDEAVLQRREVLLPETEDRPITINRDHKALSSQFRAGAILTIPLYGDGRWYGAMTLERSSEYPFDKNEVEFCKSVASLVFPALEAKRLNDRSLVRKMLDSFKEQAARLLGPRFLWRKIIVGLLAGLVLFFTFKTGDYRISANTTLEGAVQRVIAAPFDGYIKASRVRPGDKVQAGMEICRLDDKDLRLERLNWLTKRSQYNRQLQEAMAKYNRAQVKIIGAQLDQVKTQLMLIESRLERTTIRAPFDGLILSGDLSQMLGGMVKQGEVLFEIAPLNAYRVILKVDERRIADVKAGQEGTLVLSALPQDKFKFSITKLTPIAVAEEGQNYFRVEAKLAGASVKLRPGMEGVGKIWVDRRKLIAIWTRSLIEWLRIWVWSWWP